MVPPAWLPGPTHQLSGIKTQVDWRLRARAQWPGARTSAIFLLPFLIYKKEEGAFGTAIEYISECDREAFPVLALHRARISKDDPTPTCMRANIGKAYAYHTVRKKVG